MRCTLSAKADTATLTAAKYADYGGAAVKFERRTTADESKRFDKRSATNAQEPSVEG